MKRLLALFAMAGFSAMAAGTAFAGGVNVGAAIGIPAHDASSPVIQHEPVHRKPVQRAVERHGNHYAAAPVVVQAKGHGRDKHGSREHENRQHEARHSGYGH